MIFQNYKKYGKIQIATSRDTQTSFYFPPLPAPDSNTPKLEFPPYRILTLKFTKKAPIRRFFIYHPK